jgi:hypothetical protein
MGACHHLNSTARTHAEKLFGSVARYLRVKECDR